VGIVKHRPTRYREDIKWESILVYGKLVLTEQDGTTHEFHPGDAFVVQNGYTGTWEQRGDYRELAIIAKSTGITGGSDRARIMADLDLVEVRERLLKWRKDLESLSTTADEASQVVELDQARVGRLSRMDAMQAQAMAKESSRRREVALRNILGALARIDNGHYGRCLDCEEPIPPKRLEFDPAARLCIQCAERAEMP
jgi:DnaK suppressor protein